MNTVLTTAAYQALRHFAHLDESNAAIHMADVRYSPLTFRLAEGLAQSGLRTTSADVVDRVLAHKGLYEEDTGR